MVVGIVLLGKACLVTGSFTRVVKMPCRRAGHRTDLWGGVDLTRTLPASEEEGPVFYNRAAECSAQLVLDEERLGTALLEVRRCIELRIAQELEERAMKPVCAGFHRHVHHTARGLPEFSREGGRLHLEFLDGVNHRLDDLGRTLIESHDAVAIVDAIQQVAVLHAAGAVGYE